MLAHQGHCHMTVSQDRLNDSHCCSGISTLNTDIVALKWASLFFGYTSVEADNPRTKGHHSASSKPQILCRMSEGDITVLPFGPASVDLSRQEHRTLTRLYCQNGGYHLRILPDGTVTGGRQDDDRYNILRLKSVSVGVVVIKGELTGRYLAMNKNGGLYGSQALNDECYFLEKYEENHYNTYCAQKYNWYVGLKRNGQPKAGPDTHHGQKAIFFLPRPAGNM